uniref:Uncharacterized protein n=1 Tax=Neovison vison TaxID=452646 RepID=A0A8C7BHZ4_NEOVI
MTSYRRVRILVQPESHSPTGRVPQSSQPGVLVGSTLLGFLLPSPCADLLQTHRNSESASLRGSAHSTGLAHAPGAWIPQKPAPGACPARPGSPGPHRPAS